MAVEDIQNKATDFVKKVLTVGMGTLFLTEESLRGMVSEFKLPKELLGGILESAGRTRREFLNNLSQELINRVSEKVDPKTLVDEILRNNEIEVTMKLSFKPKNENQS